MAYHALPRYAPVRSTTPAGSTTPPAPGQPWPVPDDPRPGGQAPDAGPPSLPAVLDHVAHAVERWELAWPRYVTALGGAWSSGGLSTGFAPSQLRFANRARLEVLAPNDTAANPFLRRFLDRHGPGPHHLTFKVPDLDTALEALPRWGLQPVNVDRTDPDWQELFIHPRQAGGIVVQVAEAAGEWESPAPEGFPTPAEPAAALVRATHAVADLDAAVDLFAGLLGGDATRSPSADDDLDVVDVTWPGPLALRLVGPATPGTGPPALAGWLGDAPGRLHHLVLACPDPSAVPGAGPVERDGDPLLGVLPADAPQAVVPPAENLGLRLVLSGTTP